MYTNYALHHIKDSQHLPFNAADYSCFKFGDGMLAKEFGQELAEGFLKSHADDIVREKHIVYIPSPYDAIPTASFALAEAFKERINIFLYQQGKSSLLGSKIHRYKTYTEDYGTLNFEERLNLISSDSYHLDKSFLQNRMVLFLDDIRVTGSHEMIIRKQLEREEVSGNFFFLYYALLDNPAVAPQFENYLNYYEIDSILKIATLFQSPYFEMNTRVVKYILKSETADVLWLREHTSAERIQKLIAYALGNNYHLLDAYKTNLNLLIQTTHYGH